jgi:hypothetical protein
VIKHEGGEWYFFRGKEAGLGGVVCSTRYTFCFGYVDSSNGVKARVSIRRRVSIELAQKFYLEAGLFPGFPYRRFFQAFSVVHKTSGKRPAVRWILTPDKHYLVVYLYDDVHRGKRIPVRLYFFAAMGAVKMSFHGSGRYLDVILSIFW